VLTQVHATDEHRRVLAELTTRAEGTQAELGAALRGKDDADAVVHSLRERLATSKLSWRGLGLLSIWKSGTSPHARRAQDLTPCRR
jgi:hypothetical protein